MRINNLGYNAVHSYKNNPSVTYLEYGFNKDMEGLLSSDDDNDLMYAGIDISTPYRDYTSFIDSLIKIDDCYAGEDTIKARGTRYLPPLSSPSGGNANHVQSPIILPGSYGQSGNTTSSSNSYGGYILRSSYYSAVKTASDELEGKLNRIRPQVNLPEKISYYTYCATESMEDFDILRQGISRNLILYGGCFSYVDARPNDVTPRTFIRNVPLYDIKTVSYTHLTLPTILLV